MRNRKLLLTSDGFTTSKIREAFLQLLGQNPTNLSVCIIPTAHGRLKSQAPVSQRAKLDLEAMGFHKVVFVDIEFENVQDLYGYDVICLSSGNTFYLLHHLKLTGADKVIKEQSERGATLVGISVGTVVLGDDIHIVDYFTPEFNHLGLKDLNATGIYEQTIFPHYGTPDKFKHEKSHEIRLLEFEGLYQRKVERLTDNEAIYINGR
ncbi:Type 1 glutamine amidotransferase-like domain-containing protein [Paenibacillus doosanensis]|uniref:Type 1 glutamine amidotransferase-like domain-containing protein n=1 Tax=Paenibacillus doosanensis TaxID=1229154 RepID=UPI00217F85B0|nr:Type 1 glutamine amidotransferase-like domain-containing protein [Paenibacillus doosanensis]MCS7462541.1 Type 1 glutamine amidotransferase-like domain-containing protein [Paenibacillus doosanensis]